jgi:hypothetical protein
LNATEKLYEFARLVRFNLKNRCGSRRHWRFATVFSSMSRCMLSLAREVTARMEKARVLITQENYCRLKTF